MKMSEPQVLLFMLYFKPCNFAMETTCLSPPLPLLRRQMGLNDSVMQKRRKITASNKKKENGGLVSKRTEWWIVRL